MNGRIQNRKHLKELLNGLCVGEMLKLYKADF